MKKKEKNNGGATVIETAKLKTSVRGKRDENMFTLFASS